jgi:lipopolysaccharide/colanic/teichoic acid biosynthesis glycosyltransferase
MVLRQVVYQLFSSERRLNSGPELCPVDRVPSASFSSHGNGCAPRGNERAGGANILESGPNAILPDVRLPRWKRLLDLVILACTVLVWLPLILLLMCLVKLVSPGPAFYRQRRIGYRGRQFMIFKFRSMRVHAETRTHEEYLEKLIVNDTPMTKLDALDPRLIPGGRFLRAAGLDELPQIFNVLRGEMSLVGPRPCTVIEFQSYRPEQRDRVNAPPGITGYWQVNGKNKTTFKEMIAMDIFYANNMSPSLDLAIIWKTMSVVVRQMIESSVPAKGQRRNEDGERRNRTLEPAGVAFSNYEGSPRRT